MQFYPEFVTSLSSDLPELLVTRGRLHRGPPDSALYMQTNSRAGWLDGMNDVLDLVAGCDGRHTYVDDCLAVRRNHIRLDTAVDRTDIDGDTTLDIIECKELLDNVGQLQDGARTRLRIEPGMCGLTVDRNRKAPDTFT